METFYFVDSFCWHQVNLLPPCFKERNKTEQPVCAGTNQTVNAKLSFFWWLQHLLRVPSSCRFFSPSVNSAFWWKSICDQKPISQSLQASCYVLCKVCVYSEFQAQKVFTPTGPFSLISIQQTFPFKAKVLKIERDLSKQPYDYRLLYHHDLFHACSS